MEGRSGNLIPEGRGAQFFLPTSTPLFFKWNSPLMDIFLFSVEGPNSHHYTSEFKKSPNPNQSQVFRIAQELTSLSSSLPLEISSSVFVRTVRICTYLYVIVRKNPNQSQVFRIAQELTSLSSSLPLEISSSVFVRTVCMLRRAKRSLMI